MLAKKCLFVGVFTLLSLSMAIAQDPPAVHPLTGEDLVIDCLRGTPVAIDGDLSDWSLDAMTPALVDVEEQLNSGQASWSSADDFIPDLPENAFTALVEEAKSKAALRLAQKPDEKAEQEAGRQNRWLARRARRINGGIQYPNYGRKR